MEQKTTVQTNQTLLDIAVNGGRSVEAVFELMLQNALPITAQLDPGQILNANFTGLSFPVLANAFKGVYVDGQINPIARINQNLIDIALQEAGAVEAVIDLMMLNNLSITHILNAGQTLGFQMQDQYKTDQQSYFKGNNIRPATGSTLAEGIEYLEGIDYWAVQEDFIIS